MRDPGFPATLGEPPGRGCQSRVGVGIAWRGALLGLPSPAYTWAQVKARERDGRLSRLPRASRRPLRSRATGGDPRREEAAQPGPGGRCRPRPASPGLCCRCARAPRLSHCGIRGPINRESDVLQSREWRGPGSWGRGRAEPQAPRPAPPPPRSCRHVTPTPGSHLPSRAERVSAPSGSRGGGSATPPLGVTWEGAGGTRAVTSF